MKHGYLTIFYITLIIITSSTLAQTAPAVQQQTKRRSEEVVVKNFTETVTENDYNFYEISRFNAYVKKHMRVIPGANGIVEIGFINRKDGSVTNVKVVKGLNGPANNEAVRLVKQFGKWKPNTIDGQPQESTGTITVPFGKQLKQ